MKFLLYLMFCIFIFFAFFMLCFLLSYSYFYYQSTSFSPFESGFSPFLGTMFLFSMPFFMLSIMFLLFDVEILLLCFFPLFSMMGSLVIFFVWFTIVLVLMATLYEWITGVFGWF